MQMLTLQSGVGFLLLVVRNSRRQRDRPPPGPRVNGTERWVGPRAARLLRFKVYFLCGCLRLGDLALNNDRMNDIELKLNEQGRGAFVIEDAGERLAEMEISIAGDNLTVYHTEVSDKLKGQGVGTKLLERMVGYARQNKLKVIPLCPFVHAQFKRHPEKYTDIWNKAWHAKS